VVFMSASGGEFNRSMQHLLVFADWEVFHGTDRA
jgi:hypothetical protein